jgi:hypothetical protein
MSKSVAGTFTTRRDAEMAVERLVQELGVERTDIFVAAAGDDNTVGDTIAGSDSQSAEPSPDARDDGAHRGGVAVSVDVNDEELLGRITNAFKEFGAAAEVEN